MTLICIREGHFYRLHDLMGLKQCLRCWSMADLEDGDV